MLCMLLLHVWVYDYVFVYVCVYVYVYARVYGMLDTLHTPIHSLTPPNPPSHILYSRGKFAPKYIESLLRKYITEYVVCAMCRGFNTNLTKDSVNRLYFVACLDCGSSRSVAAIKSGFHAQTRADRRALRNAP
ncbi:hypothetical protein EON64_13430 [archaeon]|nr:MAG: hypothetical protein EON64_13430 [archaeon]